MSLARLAFGSEANVLRIGRGADELMNMPPKYRIVLRLRICETLQCEKMGLIDEGGLGGEERPRGIRDNGQNAELHGALFRLFRRIMQADA